MRNSEQTSKGLKCRTVLSIYSLPLAFKPPCATPWSPMDFEKSPKAQRHLALCQALPQTDMARQGRAKPGLVLPPFAIEQQGPFAGAKQFQVTGYRFRPWQSGRSQVKVVISHSQTREVGLSAGTIRRFGTTKIDGGSYLQGLQNSLKPARRS